MFSDPAVPGREECLAAGGAGATLVERGWMAGGAGGGPEIGGVP